MSLTVAQKQELIRWLESAEWWKELSYAALEVERDELKAKLEAMGRILLEFYREDTSTDDGAREVMERDLAAAQQESRKKQPSLPA